MQIMKRYVIKLSLLNELVINQALWSKFNLIYDRIAGLQKPKCLIY